MQNGPGSEIPTYLERKHTKKIREWATILVIALMVFFGINLGVSVYLINQSQHRWCSVLSTIKPRDKTEQNAPFFNRLSGLESQFGCKK